MAQPPRDGLLRRLGRALRGVDAVQYGRPVPLDDPEPPPRPTPALTVDDPPGTPRPRRAAEGVRRGDEETLDPSA